MKSTPKAVIIIGVFLAIASPLIFTMASHYKLFDFSKTGQIGDTIGGLTAPIINLISAILIYYSFNEQLKANQIQITALADEKKDMMRKKNLTLSINF